MSQHADNHFISSIGRTCVASLGYSSHCCGSWLEGLFLTRCDLVKAISPNRTGIECFQVEPEELSRTEAREAIDVVFEAMTEALNRVACANTHADRTARNRGSCSRCPAFECRGGGAGQCQTKGNYSRRGGRSSNTLATTRSESVRTGDAVGSSDTNLFAFWAG